MCVFVCWLRRIERDGGERAHIHHMRWRGARIFVFGVLAAVSSVRTSAYDVEMLAASMTCYNAVDGVKVRTDQVHAVTRTRTFAS